MRRSLVTVCALLVLSVGSAAADDRFHPVPAVPDQGGPLELRVVSFGNGIHGEMDVEVKNLGTEPAWFVVAGLYFVPDDDGGAAPQRMGIIGGARAGVEDAPRVGVTVAAGAVRRVRIDVYCIDRSRHAPGRDTSYTLASTRMPARLIAALDASTRPLLGGKATPADDATQSRIQDLVWSTRRAVRARLAGER